MQKCSEVMTPAPATCEPDDPIRRAADIMKSADVGAVPVVESQESQRLVGIITDRDIVVRVLAGGRNVEGAAVRDAMTASPAYCREDEDVKHAVGYMAERQLRRMPIVDLEGRLRGIISQADVATRINEKKTTGEMVEAISEPDAGENRAQAHQ
jgi:CBS domain-containing protein